MAATLASKILFRDLCIVYDRICKAQKNALKYEYLQSFITQCRAQSDKIRNKYKDADVSFLPILRLLLPQHVRDRGSYGMKQFALANLYIRVLCLGKNSTDAQRLLHYKDPSSSHSGGDFAEVAYRILQSRIPARESSMTVEEINVVLDRIAQSNANNESKDKEFFELVQELSAVEQKWFIRIILKDLRLGLSQKKILSAYHRDAEDVFNITMSLRDVCEKLPNEESRFTCGVELFSSFKPMLLERCKIEDSDKLFVDNKIYFVETKHDGERFQVHMKDGRFKYFSRNGFDFTEAYGETKSSGDLLTSKIATLLNSSCRSIIIDGEMMGWHRTKKRFGSKGMSFDVKKMRPTSAHQPCFVAFDIILYNDEILIDKPFRERLKVLADAFTDEEGFIIKSQARMISNRNELIEEFNKSMVTCEEGIVLKKSDCTYRPGVREGSGCYKIKAEYSTDLVEDLDLLIIGGYYGEGKFRGCVNSFLVGVANRVDNAIEFQAVCSVRSGVSIEMLEDLLLRLQPHWLKERPSDVTGPRRDPPDLWIAPKNSIILKLRATEMVRSHNYPTNYSLRFPRIVAVRDQSEKSWRECCTSKELSSLIKNPGVIQKLTKRHATTDDIRPSVSTKSCRTTRSNQVSVLDNSLAENVDIVRASHLLDGKEIYVLNGNEKMSKQDIEKLVREHGGNLVQNAVSTTFCVIVGNKEKMKARHVIDSCKYDVVTIDWLLRVTSPDNLGSLQDWFPWELESMSESTRAKISDRFDDTYDSYTQNADMESLKRSSRRAENMIGDTRLTLEQYREIDEELFDNGVPPFSIFRGIVGYFKSCMSQLGFQFRFMGGTIVESLEDTVTHVFINTETADTYKNIKDTYPKAKILSEQWIRECFEKRQLLPENEYRISSSD